MMLDLPLAGRQLIVANAGTGKTWTIENLFLRLLLERELEVRRILVVTYTEAATAELRGRIRNNLVSFLRHLEATAKGGGAHEDPDGPFRGLAARLDKPSSLEDARRRLKDSLLRFDEAAIFTIHGFCRRALRELAFETGAPFEAEVTAESRDLLWESVDDFLRRTFIEADPLMVRRALDLPGEGLNCKVLSDLGRKLADNPLIEIRPSLAAPGERSAGEGLMQAFREAARLWQREGPVVRELLHHALPRLRGYGEKTLPRDLARMAAYLEAGDPFGGYEPGRYFGSSALAARTSSGSPPGHPLFEALDRIRAGIAGIDQALAQARVRFAVFARERAARSLREGGAFHFEDLLTRLHGALAGAGGAELALRLSARFPAALIDEFQDTDPVQFGIFDAIYRDPRAVMFMVGDPKQAIYRFRGADVHAFLAAAAEVPEENVHPLLDNHRSAPGLVGTVNALFGRPGSFVLEGIDYRESRHSRDDLFISESGVPDARPFRILLLPRSPGGQAIATPTARRELFAATAREISRLLAGGRKGEILLHRRDGHTGGDRALPLGPQDIAVLVRTNRHARAVRQLLQRRGIPAVLMSAQSIFASPEATELLRLLQAIEDPGNENRLRAALATDIMGVKGEDLAAWVAAGDSRLDEYRVRFRRYARSFGRGFMAMADLLMEQEGVKPRLLGHLDGERRLTNLLHLFELLHRALLPHRGGIDAAIAWLSPLLGEKPEDDVSQLRLESDAAAVKVVTVHRSKGLQWPIVFCPTVWGEWQVRGGFPVLHQGNRPYLDLRTLGDTPEGEERKELARSEARAEGMRNLYVALTRARYRSYLGWGPVNNLGRSALSALLHGEGADPAKIDDERFRRDIESLAARSGQAVCATHLGSGGSSSLETGAAMEVPVLSRRGMDPGRLLRQWSSSSFTRLEGMASRQEGEERRERDDDELEAVEMGEQSPAVRRRDFAGMPGGRTVGDAIHGILERIDFSSPGGEAARALITSRMGSGEWTDTVAERLQHVLSTPLGDTGIVLADVPPADRVAEMRFFLARGAMVRWRWRSISGPLARDLELETRAGAITGSIDLALLWRDRYWLLDWKTNNLGPDPGDYAAGSLEREMAARLYHLQADIYSLALHRHLGARLGTSYDPARHMGGVLYLFLRGMDPRHPGMGVWCRRTDAQALEELDASLGRAGR
jgi:exodeoxyribonuclease V beta subunit